MTSLSATYYVSQRTGSDENDGRTCSTAFASLSAIVFSPLFLENIVNQRSPSV